MTVIEVSTDELEEIAFNSGETLHMGGPFPMVHVGGRTYYAPAAPTIPTQRGPLNTPPVPKPRESGGVA